MKLKNLTGILLALSLGVVCSLFATELGAAMHSVTGLFSQDAGNVMLGATLSLTAVTRQERQKTNLGGLIKAIIYGASDFTADWPAEADVVAGVVSATPPLKAGVTGAVLTFDTGSGEIKHTKKGKLGYQSYEHEFNCKFAGYLAEQKASLQKTMNEGGVVIGFKKDGKRVVCGTALIPMVFEEDGSTGNNTDAGGSINLKSKIEDGVGFAPPELAGTVTLTLPA